MIPADAVRELHAHDASTRELILSLTACDGTSTGLGGMVNGRGGVLGTIVAEAALQLDIPPPNGAGRTPAGRALERHVMRRIADPGRRLARVAWNRGRGLNALWRAPVGRGSAYSAPSSASVCPSGSPVGSRPRACWKDRSASRVFSPMTPSTVPGSWPTSTSRSWTRRTCSGERAATAGAIVPEVPLVGSCTSLEDF
jgi:hypothetical protein